MFSLSLRQATPGHKTRHKIHKPGSLTSSSPLNVGSQSRLWSSTAGFRHLRFQKERTNQHAAQAAPPSTSTEHHKTSPADTKEEEAGDHAAGEGSTVGDAGGGGGERRRGSGCRGEGGGEADPEGGGWQRVTALSESIQGAWPASGCSIAPPPTQPTLLGGGSSSPGQTGKGRLEQERMRRSLAVEAHAAPSASSKRSEEGQKSFAADTEPCRQLGRVPGAAGSEATISTRGTDMCRSYLTRSEVKALVLTKMPEPMA